MTRQMTHTLMDMSIGVNQYPPVNMSDLGYSFVVDMGLR